MDSNHRMAASKAAALPLGYTPELSSSFNKGDLLIVLVITYANFLGAPRKLAYVITNTINKSPLLNELLNSGV